MSDDGYDGPGELVVPGKAAVAVEVSLRGHFEPIGGRYRWYGRVAAGPELAALISSGVRSVLLRTPHGEATTPLADIDPWGRPRVEGFGDAPFPVMTDALPD